MPTIKIARQSKETEIEELELETLPLFTKKETNHSTYFRKLLAVTDWQNNDIKSYKEWVLRFPHLGDPTITSSLYHVRDGVIRHGWKELKHNILYSEETTEEKFNEMLDKVVETIKS